MLLYTVFEFNTCYNVDISAKFSQLNGFESPDMTEKNSLEKDTTKTSSGLRRQGSAQNTDPNITVTSIVSSSQPSHIVHVEYEYSRRDSDLAIAPAELALI